MYIFIIYASIVFKIVLLVIILRDRSVIIAGGPQMFLPFPQEYMTSLLGDRRNKGGLKQSMACWGGTFFNGGSNIVSTFLGFDFYEKIVCLDRGSNPQPYACEFYMPLCQPQCYGRID